MNALREFVEGRGGGGRGGRIRSYIDERKGTKYFICSA